jgi:tRNA A-37 threonylcarbamoyl transferase component Bud32/membrane-associated phospholipid phosphatase
VAQQEHSRLGFHAYRRPTGAPPPLPKAIGFTGWLWLLVTFAVVGLASLWLHVSLSALHWVDGFITDVVVDLRMGWLDGTTRFFNTTASTGGIALLAAGVILATGWFRRWRHIIICLISIAAVELAAGGLYLVAARPRPFGVVPIAGWEGFSSPSMPIAGLAAVGISAIYMLVVPGKPRYYAKWLLAATLVVSSLGRIYLGVDHASDDLFGAAIGVAILVAAFRAFAPNDVFPISYGKRGKSAHLDVTGKRGKAIRDAMKEQLGLTITNIKPVGLEASGGSTPLRITATNEDGETVALFAKLYAKSHVRADRWYKLGRTMLYGRLEDETPFGTVRRFVEYEDYTLRLLGDYGFTTPKALGVVEITPEREYLIAMEFFEDALEIGDAEVDDTIIDEGLQLIRDMWDIGLAHRDVKPANLMVQDGHLRLIDVFFVQVRPSAWRQAVDLGNMLLVLALRTDADRVYAKALEYFTPDELAEAFAATRGVASPTQLRQSMKQDGRDLLSHFRELAPDRKPIGIQRWSFRRVALIVGAIAVVSISLSFAIPLFFPTRGAVLPANCDADRTMITFAQAVPTATKLPCVTDLPVGWGTPVAQVVNDKAWFQVGIGDSGSITPIVVTLTATCPAPIQGDQQIPLEGGCITVTGEPPGNPIGVPSFTPNGGLTTIDRSTLVALVDQQADETLCGAGAPPC